MVRLGSALFNADHSRLGEELGQAEAAGVEFFHFDVFDGYLVADQGFPARTLKLLRPLSKLPFEVHLAARDPLRFLPALAGAGADLVFLPAESSPLIYEAVHAVREEGMKPGLCLALGTPLAVLAPVLPMVDAVLLLGRVTGEGPRGREFNALVVERVREARRMIDTLGRPVDLQAAGGLETGSAIEVCRAGATSLPLGAALHREADKAAYLGDLRARLGPPPTPRTAAPPPGRAPAAPSARFNVLVASRTFGRSCPGALDRMRAAGCVFLPHDFDRAPSEEELIRAIAEADVLISGTEPVTARVLSAAPRLKMIQKHGAGYENIDLEAARARGVVVAAAGGAIADSVADMAMGLLLAVARRIPQGDASVKAGEWKRLVGTEMRGKTLGIVGLGRIGKALCRRARGFGMRVAAHDVRQDQAFAASFGVEWLPLPELLSRADFISLHAPVTPETRGMIGAAELARMKRGAYIVNTSRGDLWDEAALFEALRSGAIAGAASDVFAREPPGASPLLGLPGFIATPHCASQTEEGLRLLGEDTCDNVLRVLRGEEPLDRLA